MKGVILSRRSCLEVEMIITYITKNKKRAFHTSSSNMPNFNKFDS